MENLPSSSRKPLPFRRPAIVLNESEKGTEPSSDVTDGAQFRQPMAPIQMTISPGNAASEDKLAAKLKRLELSRKKTRPPAIDIKTPAKVDLEATERFFVENSVENVPQTPRNHSMRDPFRTPARFAHLDASMADFPRDSMQSNATYVLNTPRIDRSLHPHNNDPFTPSLATPSRRPAIVTTPLAYEEKLERQFVALSSWANVILDSASFVSEIDLGTSKQDASLKLQEMLTKPMKRGGMMSEGQKQGKYTEMCLRKKCLDYLKRADSVYQSLSIPDEIKRMVERGEVSIKTNIEVYANIGAQTSILALLFSLHPFWLFIAVETVCTEFRDHDTSSLDARLPFSSSSFAPATVKFIHDNILANSKLMSKKKFAIGTVKKIVTEKGREILHKHCITCILSIAVLLEHAKKSYLFENTPGLFVKNSEIKTVSDFCTELTRLVLSASGTPLNKAFDKINFRRSYRQSFLEEYQYAMKSVRDMSDGIVLGRLVELLTDSPPLSIIGNMRNPQGDRIRKKGNVEKALTAAAEKGIDVDGISIEQILTGHRESCLDLMWRLVGVYVKKRAEQEPLRRESLCLDGESDADEVETTMMMGAPLGGMAESAFSVYQQLARQFGRELSKWADLEDGQLLSDIWRFYNSTAPDIRFYVGEDLFAKVTQAAHSDLGIPLALTVLRDERQLGLFAHMYLTRLITFKRMQESEASDAESDASSVVSIIRKEGVNLSEETIRINRTRLESERALSSREEEDRLKREEEKRREEELRKRFEEEEEERLASEWRSTPRSPQSIEIEERMMMEEGEAEKIEEMMREAERVKAEEEQKERVRREEEERIKREEEVRIAEERRKKEEEEEERRRKEEEEEERRRKENEERKRQEEEEERVKAIEEARIKAEEEERQRLEEQTRLKEIEDARVKAEEDERLRREEERRVEEARLKAEEDERLRVEEERRVEEARLAAEEEERKRLEEERRVEAARLAAEEEERLRREKEEEEEKRRMEEEEEERKREKAAITIQSWRRGVLAMRVVDELRRDERMRRAEEDRREAAARRITGWMGDHLAIRAAKRELEQRRMERMREEEEERRRKEAVDRIESWYSSILAIRAARSLLQLMRWKRQEEERLERERLEREERERQEEEVRLQMLTHMNNSAIKIQTYFRGWRMMREAREKLEMMRREKKEEEERRQREREEAERRRIEEEERARREEEARLEKERLRREEEERQKKEEDKRVRREEEVRLEMERQRREEEERLRIEEEERKERQRKEEEEERARMEEEARIEKEKREEEERLRKELEERMKREEEDERIAREEEARLEMERLEKEEEERRVRDEEEARMEMERELREEEEKRMREDAERLEMERVQKEEERRRREEEERREWEELQRQAAEQKEERIYQEMVREQEMKERERRLEIIREMRAARTIQSCVRAWLHRRGVERRTVQFMQSMERGRGRSDGRMSMGGFSDDSLIAGVREIRRRQRNLSLTLYRISSMSRVKAATKIQAWWRGCLTRRVHRETIETIGVRMKEYADRANRALDGDSAEERAIPVSRRLEKARGILINPQRLYDLKVACYTAMSLCRLSSLYCESAIRLDLPFHLIEMFTVQADRSPAFEEIIECGMPAVEEMVKCASPSVRSSIVSLGADVVKVAAHDMLAFYHNKTIATSAIRILRECKKILPIERHKEIFEKMHTYFLKKGDEKFRRLSDNDERKKEFTELQREFAK